MIITIGAQTYSLAAENSSYRYRTIMGENELTIYFASTEFFEIPVGAYTEFEGETYTLMIPENFKKQGTRNFEYTLILNSAQSLLDKYKFRDLIAKRLKFSLTAKPAEHLQMLVNNLNARDAGWSVGSCLEATEKTITYNHNYCNEAMSMIAQAFETEWEIIGKAIHLNRIEYNREAPLALSYGKGNGLKPGLGRTNVDSSNPMEILFVQGGERNIEKITYGAKELLLPKGQTYTYQGRQYQTDADGLFITRADKALATNSEFSLDLSNIYPSRVGTVGATITIDAEKNLFDFTDPTIPATLDYEDCLIPGEMMTVRFETGMLAGRDFEVKYIHEVILTKEPRRFEIVPTEIDGVPMPGGAFLPAPGDPGDKYIVLGVMLPKAYVSDDPTQSGASWEMFKEACKFMFENEDPRFNFTGEMDGIWSATSWATVGPKVKLGGMALFSDPQFEIEGVLVRISGIKDFINDPKRPIIELSNLVARSVTSDLRDIKLNKAETITTQEETLALINRRRNEIIYFQDDKFQADPLVRTEDLTPRMLDYDAGTPQFSLKGAIVETIVDGNQNRIKINSGNFISHHFLALDKKAIQELKDVGLPYDPTRSWVIDETTIDLEGDNEYFVYLKVPIDKDPPL